MRFKQGELTRLHTTMPLRMLLTNTEVGRNTKSLVAGVGERALRHPAAMAAIFNAIDEIAEEVVSILQLPLEEVLNHLDGDDKKGVVVLPDDFNAINVTRSKEEVRLEELVEMNQGLLQSIGVGHLSIDTICQITSAYKLRSKLTGAGGGGCVLTLLPHSILYDVASTSTFLSKLFVKLFIQVCVLVRMTASTLKVPYEFVLC